MSKCSHIDISGEIKNFDITTPRSLFVKWKAEAEGIKSDDDVFLAVLSTVGATGIIDSCTIRIISFDPIFKNTGKFIFFSPHLSGKCINILHNPNVSLLFRWKERQLIIKAKGILQTPSENKIFWDLKSEKNKIHAWESYHNKHIDKNDFLIDGRIIIPIVPFWGSVRLEPFEFDFSEEINSFRTRQRGHYFLNKDGSFELSPKMKIYSFI